MSNFSDGRKKVDDIISTLDLLPIGHTARVTGLVADGSIKRRFLDLGLINGTKIKALHKSPSGDPIAYDIRGTVIALRLKEASKITIEIQDNM